MSTFEVLIVVLNAALLLANLLIAIIYAAILWVMVQQRRIMDEQLKGMQMQLREAERTRVAAHRPVLRVEPPVLVPPLVVPASLPLIPSLFAELRQVRNIGVGVALNIRYFFHDLETGAVGSLGSLAPLGAGELSAEFPVPSPPQLPDAALTVTYADIFGNRYWTLYHFASQSHSFGEGEPPHLRR
ncbi:MAG: hypothetical protein PVTTEEND_000406 [Candidatus Fervidibacter sp.]|jgi:hypothetical protein